MKHHMCFFNWSMWSSSINGYKYQIQVKTCTVCHKIATRSIGYAEQVKADGLNNGQAEAIAKGQLDD